MKTKLYASRHLTAKQLKELIENLEKIGLSSKQIIKMLKSIGE